MVLTTSLQAWAVKYFVNVNGKSWWQGKRSLAGAQWEMCVCVPNLKPLYFELGTTSPKGLEISAHQVRDIGGSR